MDGKHELIIGYENCPVMVEGELAVAEVMPNSIEEVDDEVDQVLHRVHLLLACAEAAGCRDTPHAETMLS